MPLHHNKRVAAVSLTAAMGGAELHTASPASSKGMSSEAPVMTLSFCLLLRTLRSNCVESSGARPVAPISLAASLPPDFRQIEAWRLLKGQVVAVTTFGAPDHPCPTSLPLSTQCQGAGGSFQTHSPAEECMSFTHFASVASIDGDRLAANCRQLPTMKLRARCKTNISSGQLANLQRADAKQRFARSGLQTPLTPRSEQQAAPAPQPIDSLQGGFGCTHLMTRSAKKGQPLIWASQQVCRR